MIGNYIGVRPKSLGSVDPLVAYLATLSPLWSLDGLTANRFFSNTGATTPASVGGTVAAWTDAGSLGKNATQSSVGNRPVLRQDANGNYYLEFNGTSKYLNSGAAADWQWLNDGSAHTIIVVCKSNVLDSSNDMLLNTLSGGGNCGYILTTNVTGAGKVDAIVQPGGGGASYENLTSSALTTTDLLYLTEIGKNDATAANRSSLMKNNGTPVKNNINTTAFSATAPFAAMRIGASVGTASLFYDGNIYAIWGFGAELTTQQLSDLDTLIKAKYLIV